MLYNGIVRILRLGDDADWVTVRRGLKDEQISEIYFLFEALWPLETNLFDLLPKPDGVARAVFTGSLHPATLKEFAIGSALYFGNLIIQHPFVHAGTIREKYNPVKNPSAYRQEFLKDVLLFCALVPLIERGIVSLVPDPCSFDSHLRSRMLHMAESRSSGIMMSPGEDGRIRELARDDLKRSFMALPEKALRRELLKASPNLEADILNKMLGHIERFKENDPLAVLQPAKQEFSQLNTMKLAPNFEMALYLAQVTGSSIVTDSDFAGMSFCKL